VWNRSNAEPVFLRPHRPCLPHGTKARGTITHHHAIGRDHMEWYCEQRPPLFGKALDAAKSVLDPARILNPGDLVP